MPHEVNEIANDSKPWNEACRLVELSACNDCGDPLNLMNTECETRQGLASILYVRCHCGMVNSVPTAKCHRTEGCSREKPVYEMNTKAAIGKKSWYIIYPLLKIKFMTQKCSAGIVTI